MDRERDQYQKRDGRAPHDTRLPGFLREDQFGLGDLVGRAPGAERPGRTPVHAEPKRNERGPGLLIEMSDVSNTLLGGLVDHPSCRTRPFAWARGVGQDADRHP